MPAIPAVCGVHVRTPCLKKTLPSQSSVTRRN